MLCPSRPPVHRVPPQMLDPKRTADARSVPIQDQILHRVISSNEYGVLHIFDLNWTNPYKRYSAHPTDEV